MSLFAEEKPFLSLSELSELISGVIDSHLNNSYWVKAEIAKLNLHTKSGHCFPELVEKMGDKITAKARAIIWASDFYFINKRFRSVAKENLKDGMQLLFQARVRYDAVYGLSLFISDIDPSFTLGNLAREKHLAIEKLREDNIFDKNKQLAAPLLYKSLAVISVQSGKGYQDFVNIIDQNKNKYKISHQLYSAVLQGENAVPSIIRQMGFIKKEIASFDAVLIIRGGGDELDLSCYDKYDLAREVALFPLPIITGIGHSTNITVTEMVAYNNKITPTDVAYFVLSSFREFEDRLSYATSRVGSIVKNRIYSEKNHLQQLSTQLNRDLPIYKAKLKSGLQGLAYRLSTMSRKTVSKEVSLLAGKKELLTIFSNNYMKNSENKIQSLDEKLKLLDPKQVLRRGYSISRIGGEAIISAASIMEGDVMHTQLYSGEIFSIIEKKKIKPHGKD